MSTKIFEVGSMACEDIQSYVISAKFKASNVFAEVHDGAIVKLGGLCADPVYDGLKDWNCYECTAPANASDAFVIVDLDEVSEGTIAGNSYKIGNKLVDLKCKPGYAARCRRLVKGDKFWLGEGNFVSAPTVGEYGKITASSTLITAASTVSGANFAILASKPMTIGTSVAHTGTGESLAYEQEYLVEVL